ncbi:hypothetical protein CMI47_09535 [Candidatus Pacearchaeota archaeon]|nr:hypothetical protein [Candidatus Pacearchaeota archaeon]|tara:strand:+ start:21672 stop:22439 length:768 start_codon:yes stop_codon:yes gene_type:complete
MKNGTWLALGSVAALGLLGSRGSRAVTSDQGLLLYGTFELQSNKMFNSHGMVKMALSEYSRDPDWAIQMLVEGWNLDPEAAEALMSGYSPYMVEEAEDGSGPIVIFTYGPPNDAIAARPPLFWKSRNYFQVIKEGGAFPYEVRPNIRNDHERAEWIETEADGQFERIRELPGYPKVTKGRDQSRIPAGNRIANAVLDFDDILTNHMGRYTSQAMSERFEHTRNEAVQAANDWIASQEDFVREPKYLDQLRAEIDV